MQTKLIRTKDYLILIDEEAEIKGTVCLCYNSIKNTWDKDIILYQGTMPDYNYIGFQKIIAYRKLNKEAKELDLPLLPPFEEVNSALNNYISSYKSKFDPDRDIYAKGIKTGFIAGYKAAQQSNKQFSLEDIKKAIEMAQQESWDEGGYLGLEYKPKQIIQSISTQQLPKEFEPRMYPKYTQYDGFEEDDEIPVMTPMTFTNSEGKQELVGIYKY